MSKMIESGVLVLYELTRPFIRGLSSLPTTIVTGISSITGSGITLTNNEIKCFMTMIKSLEK